jgi:hypothetical protein
MAAALEGCDKFFLVSTPNIAMDFNNAPDGQGREKHHIAAIEAAHIAGVKHVYYTSLAFNVGEERRETGVMRAHLRTEAYLMKMAEEGKMKYTSIREGLYNESWPLYFGYYYDLKDDPRTEVVVAGDGPVCWTAISDLGLATAMVIVDPSEKYQGKILYLSNTESRTLRDIAAVVSRVTGKEVALKVVSPLEHMRFYSEDMGRDGPAVEWWVSTYEALQKGDCKIEDGTFSELLATKGVKPKAVEQTIEEMLGD